MSSSNPDSTASSDDLRGEPRTLKPLSVDPKRGLDFIGDLHGHATRLDELLIRLEYEWIDGIPRHRNRTAIFLGDYVDRGPEIRRTLETVRGMVDRGDAVAQIFCNQGREPSHQVTDPGWLLRRRSR